MLKKIVYRPSLYVPYQVQYPVIRTYGTVEKRVMLLIMAQWNILATVIGKSVEILLFTLPSLTATETEKKGENRAKGTAVSVVFVLWPREGVSQLILLLRLRHAFTSES